MGKSTETLRDNLRKSGLGYNGPYVLSQAYAKIPKLYRAYELYDKNEQLHVFDSEKTLDDAEKIRLKMNEFQKDEKVQELKIKPIDYEKLNRLYDDFVPQKEPSDEQTYFSSYFISSKEFSSEKKPSMTSMPTSLAEDANNLVITSCVEIRNKDLHDEIEIISKESKDVSNESKTTDTVCNDAFEVTQELSKRIVELEKDLSKFEAKSIAFEIALQHKSRENNSLKTVQKENENFMASLQLENAHLKQTYKDLFESVQRSKVETNQCDEVKVKDNFDEIETKNIELEYRVASLIKENEHLKLTYKNLFDSIKKSRVQTKTSNVTQNEAENLKSQLFEFAETKFSNILEKIEFFKKSPGEKQHLFENKTSVFQIKIDELEKVLTQQTKDFNAVKLELSNRTAKFEAYFEKLEKTKVVLERQLARKVDDSKAEKDQFLKEINHLRTQLENLKGKSVKTKFDKHSILGKPPADKLLINSQISKSWFTPKVDMQKSLSKPVTAQSLPKNEKDQLLKRIAYLESKLASQDIRSCQKEYHELRTLYNALKVKFDSLNRKRRETNVSKSSKPRESVSAKVHTGESSKPFSRRVSQFTTYSLQKDRKFSKNSQSFETLTPQKGFKKRASNAKHQSFETTYSCFTPVKQVWRPIKESQTFEASTSQKSFKTRTLKGKNQVFDPHSRFTPVNQVWRPKQSHLKTFKYSKSEMFLLQNKNDSAVKNKNNERFLNASKINFQNDTSNDINKWKSSSSTRFNIPNETPSFNNKWKIKKDFKSPLIPREFFSNETPVSSTRWNSTSLHRLDTTFNWFSKFGKPVSTVLKWVPKVSLLWLSNHCKNLQLDWNRWVLAPQEPHAMSTLSGKCFASSFYKWILDLAATHHMSYLMSQFISLNLNSSKLIMAANGDSMPLAGIGLLDTSFVALSDVYYISSLTMNLASVSKICDFGSLGKLDAHDSSDCSGCKLAKFSALPFNNSVSSSNAPFDLVHSDVWGPSHVTTKGGSRYYVSFIDDFTHYTWVYLMKRSSFALFVASVHALHEPQSYTKAVYKRDVGSRWAYKIKNKSNRSVERYKARLSAKGYSQEYGMDYEETFALEAKMTTYEKFSTVVNYVGFVSSHHDSALFIECSSDGRILLSLYVDDMIITGDDCDGIRLLKAKLSHRFAMKDLSLLCYFLGIKVASSPKGYLLSQSKYIADLFERSRMTDNKIDDISSDAKAKYTPTDGDPLHDPSLYRTIVGSLIYLTVTRPDIAYDVHIVSTQFQKLLFPSTSSLDLRAYCDADWAGDSVTRNSTTGLCVFLRDSLISWKSKKQNILSKSSTEVEYRAMVVTTSEIVWLHWLLGDMGVHITSPTLLYCDTRIAI
ncbi:uncharacterized mitochondrial protein-like protein [Tanacetum coccineum]|uniref:Uncharacterized mitochondrial protein-like protein n=1 Tax=Tanacetum coccineum TaxID=301880 RepID=A0ABQ4WZ42_9ASTR